LDNLYKFLDSNIITVVVKKAELCKKENRLPNHNSNQSAP